MPKFIPTMYNMVRRPDYLEIGFSESGTKKWYVDHYFDGEEKLNERFEAMENVNIKSNGSDYEIAFTVKDPTKVFGKNYKQIKWFVSDLMFEHYFENNTTPVDKLSFWFVENTSTRWVDGVPVVSFIVQLDIMATYATLIENIKGQFYFKRKHFNRWKLDFIKDKEGNDTLFQRAVPNFIESPALMNCNSFCKGKNQKVHTSLDITPQTTHLLMYGILYYSVPMEAKIDDGLYIARETVVHYSSNKSITTPYGFIFIKNPFGYGDASDADARTNIEKAVAWVQTHNGNPLGLGATTAIDVEGNDNFANLTTNVYAPKLHPEPKTYKPISPRSTGGEIYNLPYEFVYNAIFYEDNMDFFTTEFKNLIGDTIDPKNEPHLGVANHREIKLATPDKNPQTIDLATLFRTGNPLQVDTETNKIVLRTDWWNVFDPEYGGKIGYVANTATDLSASIYNSRNFIDFTGTINIPYKTDAYIEAMQTKQNQRQASYDNIDAQKSYDTTITNADMGQNITHNITDAGRVAAASAGAAGLKGLFNPGSVVSNTVNAAMNLADGIAKTVADKTRDDAKTKLDYITAKNTTDATYADLANSPANIHTSGKISTLSMLYKSIIANNEDMIFALHWFKNEIIEVDRQQIAYDMNKYGYTCDWVSPIGQIKDWMSRVHWDYMEVINFREMMATIEIDPQIIDAIDTAFKTGVIIWNLDNIEGVIVNDYSKNNYETNLFDSFRLDNVLDYYML